MSDFKEVQGQGHGSSFRVCHAYLKNAILLHSSLVASVSFYPRLYISSKSSLLYVTLGQVHFLNEVQVSIEYAIQIENRNYVLHFYKF